MQQLTAEEIIELFELQVSDVTELSSQEELDLMNRIYIKLCAQQPWEFLKTNATGNLAFDSAAGMYYITLPDDFQYMAENRNYTNNSIGNDQDEAPIAVFIGPNYQPFKVKNYSDRRQYRTHNNVCYVDLANGKIYFPQDPTQIGTSYDFDYIKIPPELGLGDYPAFPARFHKILFYAMAVDDAIMQMSTAATAFSPANQAKYDSDFADMQYWNAKLQLN